MWLWPGTLDIMFICSIQWRLLCLFDTHTLFIYKQGSMYNKGMTVQTYTEKIDIWVLVIMIISLAFTWFLIYCCQLFLMFLDVLFETSIVFEANRKIA